MLYEYKLPKKQSYNARFASTFGVDYEIQIRGTDGGSRRESEGFDKAGV